MTVSFNTLQVEYLHEGIRNTGIGRMTDGSCGIDLRAAIDKPVEIQPQQQERVPLGFRMQLPRYTCALLLPRSGLGSRGLVLANLIGLIDEDYRGEIVANLWNRSDDPITVKPLDRVCQMLILPALLPTVVQVTGLQATSRGDNGFGSTGND